MVRLKHVASLRVECASNGERPYVALEHIASWTGALIEGTELPVRIPSRAGMASVEPGDVLFGKLRPYLAKTWVVDRRALASTELMCMRARAGVESRWLGYSTMATPFVEWAVATSEGTKMPRTSWEKVGEYRPWVPSRSEQRAVADYLDIETGRIDALISKKRRMIELLEERWSAWIRQVLRSLTCPVLPLKRKWRVVDCKHRTPTYVDHGGYPVISPGDITPGRLDLSRAHRFVDEADYRDLAGGIRWPTRGDIIYSRNASIGIASYVDTDAPFSMGQDVCLVTSDDMDQLFLVYVLNSIGVDQLDVQKLGTTFSRVNISQILEINVPVPEAGEQRGLGRRFDKAALGLKRACGALQEQMKLLAERRRALITAAVTGELHVPGVAA